MYETQQIDKMSQIVINALTTKLGKRPDIRLVSNKPEARAQAQAVGFQQVTWADVNKFAGIKVENTNGNYVCIGEELAYVWRPIEMAEEQERLQEDQNKRLESLAKTSLKGEGQKLGVEILDENDIKRK